MRKILRGLAVATALTVSPLAVAVLPTAPAQAAESFAIQEGSQAPAATSSSVTPRAKARRTIGVRDLPGRNARLRFVVKPEYRNKRLVIQTRKAGKFRKTGRMRTNGRGVAVRVFDGSRRGIRYRVIAPGGRDYYTSAVTFTITTY